MSARPYNSQTVRANDTNIIAIGNIQYFLLQTLASNGDFQQLQTLSKQLKSIQLRLLWNQRSGELSVYRRGILLGKLTAGRDRGQGRGGLYIKNKGSDLTVERVRVTTWNGAAPTKVADGQSHVRLVIEPVQLGDTLGHKVGQIIAVGVTGREPELDEGMKPVRRCAGQVSQEGLLNSRFGDETPRT